MSNILQNTFACILWKKLSHTDSDTRMMLWVKKKSIYSLKPRLNPAQFSVSRYT